MSDLSATAGKPASYAAPSPSFRDELARHCIRVHEPAGPPTMTREPCSSMRPMLWRNGDIVHLLKLLEAEIPLEAGGDRRTLRLANPGLASGTTPTFWGSIQHILPGEIATAHRHAANAFRFVLKGSGALTIVDGECYPMAEGDLVLTPAGAWHEHEHRGEAPMTWLDCLDISLVQSLHAMYFELLEGERQPIAPVPDLSQRSFASGIMRPAGIAPGGAHGGVMLYPWARAEAALREFTRTPPDPFDDYLLEYINPLSGASPVPTLSIALQWLSPGVRTRARRHTGSVLYYVVRGAGSTIVDARSYSWSEGDFLSIPPWAWYRHENPSASREAILYKVTDRPTLERLGFYREQFQLAQEQRGSGRAASADA